MKTNKGRGLKRNNTGKYISHTILAVVIVPLVLTTLYRAKKGNFEAHRTIAKKTVPVWLYVSVTGVIIYCFLYL